MDNNSNFYFSGFLSFSFFFIFILIFSLLFSKEVIPKTFALKKANFISVSLSSIDLKKSSYTPQVEVKSPKVKKKNVDINNLFNDVWTPKIKKTEQKNIQKNSRRLLEIQKKIKTKNSNTVKARDKAKKNNSTADEVNEYNAKIQAIIHQYFSVPPNSQGYRAKSVITISAIGKVIDFRILTHSGHEEFDNEVDKIKSRIIDVIFPLSPEKITTRTIILLISEEET